MDKRTLLFVIALGLTLFGVNLFFQYQNADRARQWQQQQKAKEVLKQKKLEEEIVQRTAPLSSLPLAKVYQDANGQEWITSGVQIENQLITLSWANPLPERVFIQRHEDEAPQVYHLAFPSQGLGSPALYTSSATSSLPVASLPEVGRYDLQLVSFKPDHLITVALGEYIDGRFFLPQIQLQDRPEIQEAVRHDAIALLKTKDGFLPAGFYQAQQQNLIPIPNVKGFTQAARVVNLQSSSLVSSEKTEEKFYILENAYQQLVFSNYGGALAEINLPFQSSENPLSVVKEVEVDRKMVKEHPYNAYFPGNPYYTPSRTRNPTDFEYHEKGQLGGYYPLLRRDLIEIGKRKSIFIKPQYYALNLVSEYPELAELVYEVKEFNANSIIFEAVQPHRRITKRYYLGDPSQEGPYCLNLEINIEGDSRGLWLTSGVPEVEWISGGPAPSVKYRVTRNQKVEVEKIELPKDTLTVTSLYPDWLCNSNGFLGTILDALSDIDPGYRIQHISGSVVPSRLVEIDEEYNRYQAANLPGYMTLLPLKSQGGKMTFRFFAGPFSEEILKKVDAIYSNPETGYNPDYIACQTMHGWFTFISEPFAKFLLVLMKFFHSITGSWALSIVLLTISLRLMLYPLNAWSTRSMIKMQQIGPEVAAIQEKYKKDPKKAQVEIMNLYRNRGVNPASGCLPLLIQMPFLIGMFDLLKSSFALRGASFIPGWIDDLTAPDVLFSWKYPIFFIGNEFHLLPVLLGLVMFIQQRYFTNAPQDPHLMTDQQRQQRAMGNMMSVVFALMFYNFPSGLNIYWLSSTLLGMFQQWYTTKQMRQKNLGSVPTPAKAVAKR